MLFTQSIFAVLLVSLISLVGAIGFYIGFERIRRVTFVLVGISIGALLGDTFLHIIPELVEEGIDPVMISAYVLGGFMLFFALEKFVRWHHSHGDINEEEAHLGGHTHPVGHLILIGDAVHNFVDGAVIAASFALGTEIGIATTIAVILHEIPQEIADFGLLLHAGFSFKKALFWNFASACAALVGAFLVLFFSTDPTSLNPIIALAGGGFIYIAGSDLVPELHKNTNMKRAVFECAAIIFGLLVMASLLLLE